MASLQPPVPSSVSVSGRMSKQRRRDTKPEVAVRKLLHARGFRFRVNYRVPGMPRRTIDIAFTRARVAVFIDGCFWHACPDHATAPAANSGWWSEKLATNQARDVATNDHLTGLGWRVIRIWEHEDPDTAAEKVTSAVRSINRPAGSGSGSKTLVE
jgi:DNA mismatch endonuclease (patch repair protein)